MPMPMPDPPPAAAAPADCEPLEHHPATASEQAYPSGNLTAVLTGPRAFSLEERPVPEPGRDEVLVRVMATGM